MLPRDSRAAVKRRADYRPPAFFVDRIALEFDLDPDATWVTSTLAFRRNPQAAADDRSAPLVLDGEQQADVSATLDGAPITVVLTPGRLTIANPPASGTLAVRSRISPAKNVALEGLYVSSGVFCTQNEPEGFRRITFFPDRPDVLATYTVTIRADRTAYPVLLSNGNRVDAGELPGGRHFAKWHDPFPKPSYLFALVAGDLASLDDTFTTMSGREVALSIYSTAKNLPRCRHAMAFAEGVDALGRAALRPRIRPRPVHDLLRRRLQHGRDGEQGAEHLQQPPGARRPRDRDRRRLPGDRRCRRPRILPQLDRQPRDLPRLVPAVAEGRADRLPRSGIFERHGLARGRAHRRRRVPSPRPVRRGCGADGASGAAGRVSGDQQLLHGDRLREGRRSDPHAAHAARAGRVPARHGSLLPASRRAGRHLRRFRAIDAGRFRARPHAVQALV